jgi:hypothetical protein
MKKLFLLFVGIVLAQFAMAQTVMVLNLPDPCSGTGVEEWSSDEPMLVFDVFPNPTDDCVTISVSTRNNQIGKMTVEVSDLSGRLVLRKEYYSAHDKIQTLLETNVLEAGVYIITLRNTAGVISKKIIKK